MQVNQPSAMGDRPLTAAVLAGLPPVSNDKADHAIRAMLRSQPTQKLVVLDDDPTGTQTVHHVPVLTTWDVDTLRAEFDTDLPCFFLLTNSRSLTPEPARALNRDIAHALALAASGRRFSLVSRSDSTLRGHFPLETDVLAEILGPFHATILFPYFEAGGRYTIGDVHYVAEGDRLVPVAETPFARDVSFGYRSSNLRDWVEEKTGGRVKAADVISIGIDLLRVAPADQNPIETVRDHLLRMPAGAVCVVNACAPRDAEVFALATLLAEQEGVQFLYRTAAQFVSARLAQGGQRLLERAEVVDTTTDAGGLIVVGSHVPRTTEQLDRMRRAANLDWVEMPVNQLFSANRTVALEMVINRVNSALAAGHDVVVFTSRELILGTDTADSQAIAQQISTALVDLTQRLVVRPRFFIAKGGITSSDLATRGLGVKRAMVLGQILPGVPVWRLGAESRFPGLNFIVFPGNVGGPDALLEATGKLRQLGD
jgi:uncharacterized protein YgbK (DUF1537 family)